MLSPVMAALAKLGRLSGQKLIVIATMRSMTGQAIFLDRRMFPHEGTSLFGVAGIAEFVHSIGLDLLISERAMNVMTAAAIDQALFYRMVGLFVCLCPYVPMATKTKFGLFFL